MASVASQRVSTGTHPATFYSIVGNSDYYWRLLAPCRAIGAKPCMIPEVGGYYAVTQPNDDTAFPWTQAEDGTAVYPEHEGAAVWMRPDLARATHAKAMRELHGVFTVAETDDNYVAPMHQNVYMRSNGFDAKARLDHMKAVASMNRIVFSTNRLRDMYYRELKTEFGKHRLPDMQVCRNHVILEDWPLIEEYDGPVRVGWMGSPSHIWDVNLAWGALLWASRAGAKTYMIGYDPVHPEHEVTTDKARSNVREWEKVGFEFLPWVKMDGLSRMRLPLDIGLAPLQSTRFTLGKSDIKAIEYCIAGAAPVVQNNEVFTDWVHGETCLKAGSPSEMIEAVKTLMLNPRLREEIVTNAQQYVREYRGEDQLREEWTAALEQ